MSYNTVPAKSSPIESVAEGSCRATRAFLPSYYLTVLTEGRNMIIGRFLISMHFG